MPSDSVAILRRRPDWAPAISSLTDLATANADVVDRRVERFGSGFDHHVPAVILDVILSRQRNYEKFVWPTVQDWMQEHGAITLTELADHGPGNVPRLRVDNRANEPETIRAIANGLAHFATDNKIGDIDGAHLWARAVEPLRFAPGADLYVGIAPGIRIALFAYLRMLLGADAIKPDTRVKAALKKAGLQMNNDPAVWLFLAEGLAEELGLSRLWFDQLLWQS